MRTDVEVHRGPRERRHAGTERLVAVVDVRLEQTAQHRRHGRAQSLEALQLRLESSSTVGRANINSTILDQYKTVRGSVQRSVRRKWRWCARGVRGLEDGLALDEQDGEVRDLMIFREKLIWKVK